MLVCAVRWVEIIRISVCLQPTQELTLNLNVLPQQQGTSGTQELKHKKNKNRFFNNL